MSLRLNTLKINDDACIIYNHTLLECITLDETTRDKAISRARDIAYECLK